MLSFGYPQAPAELEAVLLSHPAVIAMPDPAAGEAPKAFVVARHELDPDALMAWVAERVAPHKKLRALEFIPEIRKSSADKILRRVLKAQDEEARSFVDSA